MAYPDPVQSNHYEGGSTENSRALAYPGNVTSGNLLLCAYVMYLQGTPSANPASVTDNLGDSVNWALLTKQCFAATNVGWIGLAYKVAGASAACTVTFTPATGTAYITFQIFEFANLLSDPFDKEAGGIGSSNTPATGNSPTTTQNDELVFCAVSYDGSDTTIPTPGTGYVDILTYPNGSSYMPLNTSRKAVTSTGAQSATWSTLGASRGWGAVLATFKATAGGGGESASLTPPVGAAALSGAVSPVGLGVIIPSMLRES